MMNIAEAKEQVMNTVEAYLAKDDAGMYMIAPVHQRPIFLLGAPGIGKTAIMEQVAQELQIGIVSYSMTHHTRQSALGLPRIEHHEFEGMEYEASEYTMSEIVASVYDYMTRTGERRGILFLDEINCVSETLYPSMLQFLQFKTFGKHKVPDDWVIVCAGNPPEYNKSVHDFDIVTLDRLRQIDVVPDYAVWKTYASAKGVHPAVTTFLEAKRECFYRVESLPGGRKAFVTARGWEDLAELITLYEKLGKTINLDVIEQFLRDDEIAEQFSVYYALFDKYRSDYQVPKIMEGKTDADLRMRAREAEFDERVALIGLLMDSLSNAAGEALDQESLVMNLRDVLRAAKPELLGGATVEDAVSKRIRERDAKLARRVESGNMAKHDIRKERLVIRKLKDLVAECALARTTVGAAAFETIRNAYKKEVYKIKPLADAADTSIANTFEFFDTCWGSRELLVLLAELTTRRTTTQFIARYGCDSYYSHNDKLSVDSNRIDLEQRIGELSDFEADVDPMDTARVNALNDAGLHSVENGGVAAMGVGGSAPKAPTEASASKASAASAPVAADGGHAANGMSGAVTRPGMSAAAAGNASSAASGPTIEIAALDAYYGTMEHEWGFASMSKMTLDNVNLRGKKVLDVACRRGKGVFKLSSRIGAEGTAIGVDWSQKYIDDAKADEERAWRRNGLKQSNMEFYVAFPEDLMVAGLGNESVDVVYINNVMTMLYDQQAALKEFWRVLKPGGLLIAETIFSNKQRGEQAVKDAIAIGNSVQAGRTQEEFFVMAATAGFDTPELIDAYDVEPQRGYLASQVVPTVDDDPTVTYQAVALNLVKPAV